MSHEEYSDTDRLVIILERIAEALESIDKTLGSIDGSLNTEDGSIAQSVDVISGAVGYDDHGAHISTRNGA